MKKKLVSLLVIAISVMMLAAGCGTKDKEDNAGNNDNKGSSKTETGNDAQKDTFKVGLEAAYPPFNWTQLDDSNGAVPIDGSKEFAGGYDVEIAKKIAASLGKELVIVKTEWDGLLPALLSGKIDAIIAGMSPTEDRKQSIDFTDNYYESELVMVVKKGEAYENATSIQDFSGAKITAQLNTFHYTVIDQIQGVKKETAMDNFAAMRVALEAGAIDGYVSERPEGVSASAANANFAMVVFTEGFQTTPDDTAVAVGIQKGSELTAKINDVLAGITKEERVTIMDNAIKNQPASE